MKNVLLFVGALLAGAMGGSLTTFFVLAHERRHPEPLIRAHRFELVNETGQTTSFWGVNKLRHIELAFGTPLSVSAARGESLPVSVNQAKGERPLGEIVPRLEIGFMDKPGPFLSFLGSDQRYRVLLGLDDFGRPGLWMSDGHEMGLTLGSERSDTPDIRDKREHWALNFLPEDTARVGIRTEPLGTSVDVHGFVWINPKPGQLDRIMK